MTTFLNVDTAEQVERLQMLWFDAPVDQDELLGMVLDVAREQVIAFASEKEEDENFTWSNPPRRFVYAQLQQAKNLWNAGSASPAGTEGPEGYTYVPRPLDKTIRGIIRPTSGAADVF